MLVYQEYTNKVSEIRRHRRYGGHYKDHQKTGIYFWGNNRSIWWLLMGLIESLEVICQNIRLIRN